MDLAEVQYPVLQGNLREPMLGYPGRSIPLRPRTAKPRSTLTALHVESAREKYNCLLTFWTLFVLLCSNLLHHEVWSANKPLGGPSA